MADTAPRRYSGDVESASAQVGESMASAFVAWGTTDRGRAELERRREAADSMLVPPPSWGIPAERIGHWAQAIRRHALAGGA